jgi:glycosyltransferase involved in cell wall biosynthesis
VISRIVNGRAGIDWDDPRVLIAPHEIGGQMQLLAEELRRRGIRATAASYDQEWFGYVDDIQLNIAKVPGRVRTQASVILFTLWAAQAFDVFHFFWGSSLLGFGRHPHLDLPLLRAMGKRIFVHFRGLDLVDLEYFDYLRAIGRGESVPEPPMSRPEQLESLRRWRKHAHGLLVSEPDLLWVAPEAELVQQAIDLTTWSTQRVAPQSVEDGIIRVVHAPSMRRKKGTEFVEASVAELQDEGLPVELILLEGMPATEVQAHYQRADIGIDQVIYGWYGKVSVELMATGRPVICYINDELRPYRADMPIVSARPTDLTDQLRTLVRDADLRNRLGDEGIEYVERHHDVRSIVDQCLALYRRGA